MFFNRTSLFESLFLYSFLTIFYKSNLPGGIITKEDLAQYRCKRRTALMIEVDDVHIYSPPPPGSGAVFSLAMNILEGKTFG